LLQQERLLDLGNWLKINGKAIYGTKPYTKFYEEKEVVITETVPNINYFWNRNSPHKAIACDYFKVVWKGYIKAPETTYYTFSAIADDYMKLMIDGNEIFSNYQTKDERIESNAEEAEKRDLLTGNIKLEKEKIYPITVYYQEEELVAEAHLFWQYGTTERQIVPAEAFFINPTATTHGLQATYSSLMPYIVYTTNKNCLYAIALEFPDEELRLSIPKPSKNTKISMLGRVGNLPWKYKNGILIIDTESIKYSEIQSTAAWVFEINLCN
jgi:hypothetical protein